MRGPPDKSKCEPWLDVVVGLGSNLGDRRATLETAIIRLSDLGQLAGVSALYETPPLGPPQPDYLNAAVRLRTRTTPAALLQQLLQLEQQAGRERRERWGPRTLDLDLLWGADLVLETVGLKVPHPELAQRAFALLPLLDVAPQACDPRTGASYAELVTALDNTAVRRLSWPLQDLRWVGVSRVADPSSTPS